MQPINAESVTEFPDAPDIESSTADYAKRFSGAIGNWLVDRQTMATRKALTQFFPGSEPFTVLDVGGGHGQNIEIVNELGGELTIIGSDDTCSQIIGDELSEGKASFATSSLLALPYKDNSFDVVICYRVLSHMASWEALIAEMSRVSRCLVLVDYPSKKSVNIVAGALFSIKKMIEKNTRPYGCYRDKEIDKVFDQSGMVRSFEYRQFFLPMVLYRFIGNVAVASVIASFFRVVGLTDRFGSPVISGFTSHMLHMI